MIFLVFIAAAAVLGDIMSYSIPNRLIVTGWAAGAVLQVTKHGVKGIGIWGVGSVLPILLLYLLFYLKMFGAGDIKLLSVIGGIGGIRFCSFVFCVSLLVGAAMALVKMIWQKQLYMRFFYFFKYMTEFLHSGEIKPYYDRERDGRKCVIRFSVAICAGVFAGIVWKPVLLQ